MDRWTGKVAIVTGASSGIGAAIARSLVKHGVKVVGLARRIEKLQELTAVLGKDKFYPIQCDLSKEEDILAAFTWIEKNLGGADILINNAAVATGTLIIDGSTADHRKLLDTNVLAPTICAREYVQSIKKRNVPGHIINICSIAGRFADAIAQPFGMYGPSKYALRALGSELRHELIIAELRIKITNISPGAVLTEMLMGIAEQKEGIHNWQTLKDQDIADAAIYALGTPEGAEIHEITVMPASTPIAIANKKFAL